MPLAYFNYCRDIIRHKWPFRGFYLCSLGSITRDAGLLYYRASGFWTVEWDRGCNTWIQLFTWISKPPPQAVARSRSCGPQFPTCCGTRCLITLFSRAFTVLPINASVFPLFGPAFSDLPTSFSTAFLVHLTLSLCPLFLSS